MDDKLVIIQDTSICEHLSPDKITFWEPTREDLFQMENILKKAVRDGKFNFLQKPRFERIKDYYRQYICYTDENGDKIVYVNAFCEIMDIAETDKEGKPVLKPQDWKNELIIVFDGGSCYWQVKINLTKKTYTDFNVNGEA